MKRTLWAITFFAFIFLLGGCSDVVRNLFGMSEGIIEYEATPVDPNNPLATYAPNKMTLKFKDDLVSYGFSAGLGMFNMNLIADPKEKKVTQMVKLLAQKMVHISDYAETAKDIEPYKNITITKSSETKEIAGYTCKKAVVTYADNTKPPFNIFYCDKFKIQDPNWCTPFSEIEGMLMEYQIERFGLEMKFTAKSVLKEKIDASSFLVPKDYKTVPKKQLDDIFDSFK